MVPVAIYACGIACVMPAMSTAALAPFTKAAGAAAAMMGFFQMGAGLLVGSLGALVGSAMIAMAVFIPLMALGACVSYALHTRLRQPPAPEPSGQGAATVVLPTGAAAKNVP